MPITPSSGLGNRIEAGQIADYNGEVDVNASFDQLRADAEHRACLNSRTKSGLQASERLSPMCRAHRRAEMDHGASAAVRSSDTAKLIETTRISLRIYDYEAAPELNRFGAGKLAYMFMRPAAGPAGLIEDLVTPQRLERVDENIGDQLGLIG